MALALRKNRRRGTTRASDELNWCEQTVEIKSTHTFQPLPQNEKRKPFFRSLEPLRVPVPSRPSSPSPTSQCELRLCLLQGSPGSLVAPPWTSTPRSLQETTLPWLTRPQRAKLATWLAGRTLSQRPTWDSSPTRAWDESKPPPKESWRSGRTVWLRANPTITELWRFLHKSKWTTDYTFKNSSYYFFNCIVSKVINY